MKTKFEVGKFYIADCDLPMGTGEPAFLKGVHYECTHISGGSIALASEVTKEERTGVRRNHWLGAEWPEHFTPAEDPSKKAFVFLTLHKTSIILTGKTPEGFVIHETRPVTKHTFNDVMSGLEKRFDGYEFDVKDERFPVVDKIEAFQKARSRLVDACRKLYEFPFEVRTPSDADVKAKLQKEYEEASRLLLCLYVEEIDRPAKKRKAKGEKA